MSDTDPTASIHAATPRLDSNGDPTTAKVVSSRQSVADQWFSAICFITCVAAFIAFLGLGNAFPKDVFLSDATQFNPLTGVIGAIGAVLGFLPFIGIFAVLRVQEA